MTNEEIAEYAHEINRAVQSLTGEEVSPPWNEAPEYQRASTYLGVDIHRQSLAQGLTMTPEQSHREWLAEKERTGWVYGPVKDADKKEHPCILPYAELPLAQKLKDHLFRVTVFVLSQEG